MIIHNDISLKPYNTFKVDVFSKKLVIIESIEDLKQFYNSDLAKITPQLIMGGGSNLLFTGNHTGVIVKSHITGIEKVYENDEEIWLKTGSGVVWDEFIEYCANRNLGGVENLSGIPGNVGAAPVQNIGAYGVEAKDTIINVEVYNPVTNSFEIILNKDCRFGYRDSTFKTPENKNLFVTHVTFGLRKNPMLNTNYGTVEKELEKYPERNVKNVRKAIINIRNSKLPGENLGSAGSFFKNPVIENFVAQTLLKKYSDMPFYKQSDGKIKVLAAWLIEKSGLKGYKLNNVGTYEKQPLIIVNYGNATGKDIEQFSATIQKKVMEMFDIMLLPEVCFIKQ